MSSYQNALCARIVRTGDIATVISWGITSDDFTTAEAKNMWTVVRGYYDAPGTRGAVVDEPTLRFWFKDIILQGDMPNMPTEALCHEVRRERIATASHEALARFASATSVPVGDYGPHLAALHKDISDMLALGTTACSDVTLRMGVDNVQMRMRQAKEGVDYSCMKWPWKAIQDATFGVQPADYIVFYGRPKSMKTWVLIYLAAQAFDQQKKILIYTKEMTPESMYLRLLSCILGLPYDELREAASGPNRPMRPEHEEMVHAFAADVMNDPHLSSLVTVLSGQDVGPGADTVPWLSSKIEQYKPDIVFIDGLYLMSSHKKATSDHERVMTISRSLRAVSLSTKLPIIATMQANRKAAGHSDANLDEIAYSDALAQDCTTAARVIADKHSPFINIVLAGTRDYKLGGFRINAVPSTNFSYDRELTEKDIEKAREEDAAAAEAKKQKKVAKPAKTNGAVEPNANDTNDQIDAVIAAEKLRNSKSN